MSARRGLAGLTATLEGGATRLTRVAHRSPMRLLPMRPPAAREAGAAICALGSYGGGLLGGDAVDLHVRTERGATLSVTTQASTKVYRAKADGAPAEQRILATVGAESLLVVAPDPIVPFAQSAYRGLQSFVLEPGASVVAVDWVGSGRAGNGERWAHSVFSSRTELRWASGAEGGEPDGGCSGAPWLVEAMDLPGGPGASLAFDLGETSRDAYATVVIAGARSAEVAERFYAAAAALAARRMQAAGGVRGQPLHDEATAAATTLRLRVGGSDDAAAAGAEEGLPGAAAHELCLLGDVLVGVGAVVCDAPSAEAPGGGAARGVARRGATGEVPTATVARVAGAQQEDVYRVLHHCLAPLAAQLGVAPYADRLHARATARIAPAHQQPGGTPKRPLPPPSFRRRAAPPPPPPPPASRAGAEGPLGLDATQRLRLTQLCDATLPTGGFSHSGGLEAAMQLGLLVDAKGAPSEQQLAGFAAAAARSAAQLQAPFAAEAHAAVAAALRAGGAGGGAGGGAHEAAVARVGALSARVGALLAANPPAARASEQQGGALARIVAGWLRESGAQPLPWARAPPPGAPPPGAPPPREAALALALRGASGAKHGAPMLGAACALLGLPAEAAIDALAYTSTRDLLSAAVRLGLVGPLRAVALQADVGAAASDAATAAATLGCEAAAGAAPVLDLAHTCQDLFDRRLFQS